jgi:hypothetical protein
VQINHGGIDDSPKLSDSASQATKMDTGGSLVSNSVHMKGETAKIALIEEFSEYY